jgi:hypothetical protein
MRKTLLTFTLLVLFSGSMFSQPFGKDSQAINLGIGFGNTILTGSYYSFTIPVIAAAYEYGLVEIGMGPHVTGVISAGGFLGYANNKYKYPNWTGDVSLVYNTFQVSARGNYHFIFHDKIDTYAGIQLGYAIINSKWKGDSSIPPYSAVGSKFAGGGYVGGRYYWNDSWAVYAELGWMLYIFSFGVTYRLYN